MTASGVVGRGLGVSERASKISPSASMALDARAKEMKARGIPVISFGLGEPDFPTPRGVKAAAERALEQNATHYTTVGGELSLRKLVAERTAEVSGVPFGPSQVVTTAGAKEALYLAFQAICDPGDEVIIPAPYWVSYAEQARLGGAEPIIIQTDPENWKLTPELLQAHLTERTRALVLCSPSNPTGIVYSDAELAALAAILREANVAAIVDEIYARISYVPVGRWLRVAPDLADQTLIVSGVSKAYAMTGWRVGWLVGPNAIISAVSAIESHSTSHPSSIAQRAAEFALGYDAAVERDVEEMVSTFRERRDAIVAGLSAIDGIRCPIPEGAFYVFPDVRELYGRAIGPNGFVPTTSADIAAYLLSEAFVSAVPGEAFGTPGFLRFSYALSMPELQEGVQRMERALG